MTIPNRIEDESQLEEMLSEPTDAAIRAMQQVDGDVILLGAGGKMGPTLARMARRAADAAGSSRRIIAVSRFSDVDVPAKLDACGVETISGDVLDAGFVNGLPAVPNVVYLVGMKFGATREPAATWAANVCAPTLVCERFHKSRIVALSTGNVYPLVPVDSGGARETDACDPLGEYAMSALGRERVFQHYCESAGIPLALIRLNYAVEMRYGVLLDIARKVWAAAEVDVTMGYVNVIWQADANSMILAALSDAARPPFIVNVAGPECLSIRDVADEFASVMARPARLTGSEAPTAVLSNGSKGHGRYGPPRVSADQLIRWIADWVMRGGRMLEKPTHFEVRDGKF